MNRAVLAERLSVARPPGLLAPQLVRNRCETCGKAKEAMPHRSQCQARGGDGSAPRDLQSSTTTPAASDKFLFGRDLSGVPTFSPGRAMDDFDAGTALPDAGAGSRDASLPGGVSSPPQAVPAQQPAQPPAAACIQPINWSHGSPSDNGPDGIQVQITWGSSTGRLADLANCELREVVTYDPIPNPPFLWNPRNPTIMGPPATSGGAPDTHSYPPGLANGITRPRQAGTMVAHQVYQFRCTGAGCSGSWTDFPGQTYTITRQVEAYYVYTNPWRYRITKTGTGAGNNFSYSRQVEVPA